MCAFVSSVGVCPCCDHDCRVLEIVGFGIGLRLFSIFCLSNACLPCSWVPRERVRALYSYAFFFYNIISMSLSNYLRKRKNYLQDSSFWRCTGGVVSANQCCTVVTDELSVCGILSIDLGVVCYRALVLQCFRP